MITAVESTRVGIAKYLVPLAFAYNPSLLLVGPTWLSVASTILAIIGLWYLSTGLEGWCRGALNGLQRTGMLIAAAMTLLPPNITVFGIDGYILNVIGVALGLLLVWSRVGPGARSSNTAGSGVNPNPVGAD
jgi:TRAP-type uncharacterized transport system fused permease subunit